MRNTVSVTIAIAFFTMFIGTSGADVLVTGGYSNVDQSVMGQRTSGEAFRTQVQIGTNARLHTASLDIASGAGRSMSNAGNGGGADFQWGQSQTEQSWKQWRTVEDVGVVVGLVNGDCRGDNSDDAYRKQMNQNRKGYMSEPLVTQAQCVEIHATNK